MASSVRRARAVTRAVFTHAHKRRLLDWDPWEAVDPERDTTDGINPDLVMSPAQIRALAAACGTVQPRDAAFVLTQGLCGLRPGEAQARRLGDFRVTSTRDAAIVARATHSAVPTKFFLDGEDRRRPLKGRGVHSQRSIPVPEEFVGVLRRHVDRWAQPDPGGLVFTNTQGGRVHLSNFHRDVWSPAREATFPASSPLRQVRLHDLRHAMIAHYQSNSGVMIKTCQRWSGHRRSSVLLDTYLGVTVDEAVLSISRFEDALNVFYDGAQRAGEDGKPFAEPSQASRKRQGSRGRRWRRLKTLPRPHLPRSAAQIGRFAW